MPGVVTLELAATRAAQRVQVDTQTPRSVRRNWSQKKYACVRQTPVRPLMPSADGGRMWSVGSREWSSPGSMELHMFDN